MLVQPFAVVDEVAEDVGGGVQAEERGEGQQEDVRLEYTGFDRCHDGSEDEGDG